MQDRYGRKIDYVRISVTDRCNLRCVYCMPEEGVTSVSHDRILTYDEITHLCKVLAKLGVKKIKLTGGEPLVRKNLSELVRNICQIEGIEVVTLTTNGILLEQQIEALVEAGISGINISLDTLDEKRFSALTRGGNIEAVKMGIDKTLCYNEVSVKLNCVSNYSSDEEILEIVQMAKEKPLHIRFIELMPIGMGKNSIEESKGLYNQEKRITELLEREYGVMTPYDEVLGNGPSQYYSLEGVQGKIGFISAMSHKFCNQCNRVRLTSEGYLKTCLQYDIGEDLFPILREGGLDEELEERIQRAIAKKPRGHEFLEHHLEGGEDKAMSQIGG